MERFIDIKNEIRNGLSDRIKKCEAFDTLWESWTEESDYSVVEAIVDTAHNISPEQSLVILKLMIKKNVFSEKLVYKLIDLLKCNPFAIGSSNNKIQEFKDFSAVITDSSYLYTFTMLNAFAELLEFLFAYGYRQFADNIAVLYEKLPQKNGGDERHALHRKLVAVYKYNGMNYSSLQSELEEMILYCKDSKQKFMYGEIYYYYAILEILSGNQYSYNAEIYLEKSCKYRYDLAQILKSHI